RVGKQPVQCPLSQRKLIQSTSTEPTSAWVTNRSWTPAGRLAADTLVVFQSDPGPICRRPITGPSCRSRRISSALPPADRPRTSIIPPAPPLNWTSLNRNHEPAALNAVFQPACLLDSSRKEIATPSSLIAL